MWYFMEHFAATIAAKLNDVPLRTIHIEELKSPSATVASEAVSLIFSLNVHESGLRELFLRELDKGMVLQAANLERLVNIC